MNINDRFTKILEYSGFTASEFADEIDVQRSSISHIISGRNKPSLEFIVKIKNRFPEISWDWIILGQGEMLQNNSALSTSESKINLEEENSSPDLFTLIDEDYKNEIFSNENLFVKRIATKPEAMIINDITFAFNTLYSIYDLNKLSKKSLLIILNSKLISFYYELVFNLGMNLTTQITVEYLKQIPISIPKEEKEFIQKADLMLELNKKLQELKQNFINELNLEKVPTKLQKFEELDFDDFVKEYAKAKKLKFADKLEERNFKNEWQRLFENDKKEVLEIQNQINITDKEIDQMVYKLYDLTPDEIKIIEGN